ncbi:MAG: hypothetical protein ACYDHU_05140 [Acidimicrobiales bacterium]
MVDHVPTALDGLVPVPTFRDSPSTPGTDISGVDPNGAPAEIAIVGSGHCTLVLFLSSSCHGCGPAWQALTDPEACGLAAQDAVVAVTRVPPHEDADAVRALAPSGARVVMSDAAWHAYRVHGPPFFALVDGSGSAPVAEMSDRDPSDAARDALGAPEPIGSDPPSVMTEGVMCGLAQLAADVRRALQSRGSSSPPDPAHPMPRSGPLSTPHES